MAVNYAGARVALILGGEKDLLPRPSDYDFVVAADSGLDFALAAGLEPALVIGDFDSVNADGLKNLNFAEIIKLPRVKDDTDTLAAMRELSQRGVREVDMFCAFGARLDHQLANLQVAAWASQQGIKTQLKGFKKLIAIQTKGRNHYPYSNSYFSILSLCDLSKLTIKGAKYEAEDLEISNLYPIGISNEWLDSKAGGEIMVDVSSGMVAVFIEDKV